MSDDRHLGAIRLKEPGTRLRYCAALVTVSIRSKHTAVQLPDKTIMVILFIPFHISAMVNSSFVEYSVHILEIDGTFGNPCGGAVAKWSGC